MIPGNECVVLIARAEVCAGNRDAGPGEEGEERRVGQVEVAAAQGQRVGQAGRQERHRRWKNARNIHEKVEEGVEGLNAAVGKRSLIFGGRIHKKDDLAPSTFAFLNSSILVTSIGQIHEIT